MKKAIQNLRFRQLKSQFVLILLFAVNLQLFSGIVEKSYYFNAPLIYEKENYHYLEMDECYYLQEPTKPQLPVKEVKLLLPPGEKAVKVWVNGQNLTPIDGEYLVYPSQFEQIVSDYKYRFTEPDMNFYNSIEKYPEEIHSTFHTQYYRGHSIVVVQIYPVVYEPKARKLSYYQKLNVKVESSSTAESENSYNNLYRGDEATRQRVQDLAQNNIDISKYPLETDSKAYYDTDYLIITTNAFKSDFDEFVKFKKLQGYNTAVVTVETIVATYSGYDTQDRIRLCIRDYYQNHGTDYVLLGGDTENVPHRGLFGHFWLNGDPPTHEADDLPADLYYAGLDRVGSGSGPDWNVDDDSMWGEVDVSDPTYGDITEADFTMEVFIGRICADSHTEFANALNKQIMYQKYPVISDNKKSIMVGQKMWAGYCGDEAMEEIRLGGTYNGYATAGFEDGGFVSQLQYACQYFPDTAWPVEDLVAKMNDGASIMSHLGHGNVKSWMNFNTTDGTVDLLTSDGINHNFHMIYTQTCLGGSFDNRYPDGSYTTDCLSEVFTTHENGFFAIVSNSRFGLTGVGQKNNRYFFDAMFKTSNPIRKLGEMLSYAKDNTGYSYGSSRWQNYEQNLFGDPSLELWTTSNPSTISSAVITSTVYIGMSQVTVQVSPAISGLRVSVMTDNSDALFGTALTNSSGIATIYLNHAMEQEAIILGMVTAEDYLPFEFAGGPFFPRIWTGAVSTNWHDAENWEFTALPTFESDVIIPNGCPNYPRIWAADAFCTELVIEAGTSLEIMDQYLIIQNSLQVYGELIMSDEYSVLTIEDHIMWENGSSASITNEGAKIEIYDNWYFNSGADVYLDMGTVYFVSSDPGSIIVNDVDSYFNNVEINKTSGSFSFDNSSVYDLQINGALNITAGDNFTTNSSKKIILNGNFTCNGNISFNGGTFKLTGPGKFLDFNTGDYLHNLDISTTSGSILYSDIEINGDMFIHSGGLVTMADIYIKGDWHNYGGTSLFAEETNKVVFNGSTESYVYGEDFYTLEVNKSGEIHFLLGNTSCQYYNWENGNFWMENGTVTFYDLVDPGLFGTIIVDDGTLNIYQDASQYADLNCELYQNGGTINIFGSAGMSYWGVSNDCEIVIEDGVLDFKDVGIRLYNSPTYNLGGEINGGVIRTAGSLMADEHNINITNGTFELYGPSAASLNCSAGYFHHFNINKSGSKDGFIDNPVIDPRQPNLKLKAPKANDVNMNTNITLNGNLTITGGTLNCQGWALTIFGDLLIDETGTLNPANSHIIMYGDWTNNHGPAGFTAGTSLVNFTGSGASYILTDETYYDLEINISGSAYDYVWMETNKTITVNNDMTISSCSFRLTDNSTLNVEHDLIISENTNLFAASSDPSFINIGNNWFNYNTTGYPWATGFYYGESTVTFNSLDDQFVEASSGTQEFYNLVVDKGAGWFMPIDYVTVYKDVDILEGSWNQDATSLIFSFYGDFYVGANGSYNDNSNLVKFVGPNNQFFTNDGINNIHFKNIYIVKDDLNAMVFCPNKLPCYYLWIQEGTLDLNHDDIICDYRVQINEGGKLHMDGNSSIQMADQGSIMIGGGELSIIGSPTTFPRITHQTGNYSLSIYGDGKLTADKAIFEYLNTNGINVYNNGLIDDVNSLNNCTFRNGQAGGTLIRFVTDQSLNIENAIFPDNTWSGSFNVTKSYSEGEINFINATGDFSGEAYENDPNNLINWELPGFNLDVKVYLEGPYENGLMSFNLMPEIPLNQPYSGHPWYYDGAESVSELPGKTVDWVLVELRDATSATLATSGTVIARQAALLKNNGIILNLDGSQSLQFSQSINDQLYLVIYHRNHLAVMSAYPLTESGGVYSYDFSTTEDQAYGDADAHKEIAPNVYGMIGGDANLNGSVNSYDKGFWNLHVGESGYLFYDFNLDGQVGNRDKNDILIENYGRQKQVPN